MGANKSVLGTIRGPLGLTWRPRGDFVRFGSIFPRKTSPKRHPFWHDFRTRAAKSKTNIYFWWILRGSQFLCIFCLFWGRAHMQSVHACAVQTHFFVFVFFLKKGSVGLPFWSILEALGALLAPRGCPGVILEGSEKEVEK